MLQTLNRLDGHLSKQLRLNPEHPVWIPAALLAYSGDSWIWAIALFIIWVLHIGGPIWHRFSAILEISVIFQAMFVFALKGLIKRQRPIGEWGDVYRNMDPHSFPSGHATRVVMLAVLAIGLGPAWFAWLIGIWAPLVCVSRVITGVHYLTDILGGIVLGLLLGLAAVAISPLWAQWLPGLF